MNHRTAIGLLLAALALLAVGLAVWSFAPGASGPASLPGERGADRGTAASAAPATGSATAANPDIVRDEVAAPAGAEPVSPSATWTLRVVDEADRPLPGAEVGCHVERDVDDYADSESRERDAWAGDVRVVDAAGEVRIPLAAARSWTVYGRTAERWGVLFVEFATAQAASPVPVLRLQPDRTLRARVLDDANRPLAGVRVCLADDEGIAEQVAGAWRVSEAPDGIATFRHVQQFVNERWQGDGVVALDCPTDPLVFAPVRFDDLPAEPIELRLPATGAVVLTLVDQDGRRVDDTRDELSAQIAVLTDGGQRRHQVGFRGAELRLQPVGLGLRLAVRVDEPEVTGSIEFAGPTQLFEVIERTFAVVRHPTLGGRLVDRSGAPQQGYWFATHLRDVRGIYNQYFETGADGRFVIGIPEPGPDAPRALWFHRTLPDREHHAFCRLDDLGLHGGRNEIGDVVLGPPPLLVEGTVVDEAGKPVAGAELAVLRGTPDEAWSLDSVERPAAVSDADGAFRVTAHHLGTSLLLQASRKDSRSELVPFVVGGPPVTCVLPSVGAARMPITLRGDLTPEDLVFEFRDVATGRGRAAVARYVWRDGAAEWRGLQPARYEFSVRLLGAASPSLAVTETIVRDTTVTLPAQELGDGVQRLTVTVRGDDGATIDAAYVVVDPEGPAGPARIALIARDGRCELHKGTKPVDLLVIAPGCRQQLVRGVTGDATVRLARGIEVEVTVVLPAGFPGDGNELQPHVRRYDPADPDPRPWQGPRDLHIGDRGRAYYPACHSWLWNPRSLTVRDGRFTITVPGPGDYAVDWDVEGASAWRELRAAARRVFSVAETNGTVRVALTLSDADVR